MSKQGAPLNVCGLTAESNPMLNNVVLQTLIEHAALADFKNMRKVCKLWFELSLPRWRREYWVRVTDDEEEEDGRLFLGKYVDLMDDKAGALEGDFYQFRKYPFRRFKFAGWELRSDIPVLGDLTRQADFWKTCGTRITHLEIKDSTFRTFQSFPSIICGSGRNLKVLRLLGNRYPSYQEDDDFRNAEDFSEEIKTLIRGFKNEADMKSLTELEVDLGGASRRWKIVFGWAFLLSFVPNMKTFKLANTGSDLLMILRVMSARKTEVDWKLEKLDILQIESMRLRSLGNDPSNLLSELRFPLTELCLDIGIQTSAESFNKILETYADSLRKLVVYRASGFGFFDESDIVQYFPFDVELNNLSELWLVGAAVSQNLNILRFTPNLKRLLLICNIGRSLLAAGSFLSDQKTLENLLNGRKWKERDFSAQNSVIADTDLRQLENLVCSQLEDFIVSGTKQGYCTPRHVAALAKLMPNLKRIMLGLGNDGFCGVCDTWKKLEALVVQPYAVDEYGITGIVPGIKSLPRLPNITDLKSLRYFGMGYETETGDKVGLSDDSYENGIFELPNLRELTVVCADGMSGEVRAQLRARFPNGKILNEGHSVREWHLDEQADLPSYNGISSGGSDEGTGTSGSDSSDDDSNFSVDESSNSGVSDDEVNENEDQDDEVNENEDQDDEVNENEDQDDEPNTSDADSD